MASNFFKQECNVCTTGGLHWHYRDGDRTHCTDHTSYTRRQREKVGTVQGGSLYSRIAHEVPSEREIRIANRLDRTMWRMAAERKPSGVCIAGEDWAKDLFLPEPEAPKLDLNQVYCSFCGAPVDQVHTLTEKRPVIRFIEDAYQTESGEIIMQSKVTSSVQIMHACPNCVLQVRKPVVVRRV